MFTVTNHLNGLLSIDGPGVHHVIPLAELRTIRVLGTGVLTKQDSAIFIFSIDDSFTVQCNNNAAIIDLVESVKVHWNNYKAYLHQFENSIQNPVVVSGRANSVVIQWGVNTVPVTLSEIRGITLNTHSLVILLKNDDIPVSLISARPEYLVTVRKALESFLN